MLQNVPEGRNPVKMLNSMSLICSRGRQNSLASRNPFHTNPHSRFWPEPAERRNRPPSDPRRKRHHGRFPASPNMAQTPFRSSAVPLRCFPPVVDLTDAFFACIPPRQRKKIRRGAALGRRRCPGGEQRCAHGRHGVPVARPTTVNAGAYPGTTETVLLHAGTAYRSEPCAIARFIALK